MALVHKLMDGNISRYGVRTHPMQPNIDTTNSAAVKA